MNSGGRTSRVKQVLPSRYSGWMQPLSTTQRASQGSESSMYVTISFLIFGRLPVVAFIPVRASDPEGKNIAHIFFPLPRTPCKVQRQVDDPAHPDYAVHEPTENHEEDLEHWLRCVNERICGEHQVQCRYFRFRSREGFTCVSTPCKMEGNKSVRSRERH